MRSEITVVLTEGRALALSVDADEAQSFAAARDWLDARFTELNCEPLRDSGKVLLSDKVLAVAAALDTPGAGGFDDAEVSRAFARAAGAALGKSEVTVDVARMSVTY